MDQSPLKKIAPELRNQIYELVLTASGPIAFRFSEKDQTWICDLKHRYGDLLAITETCRAIHSECKEMVYALNTFELKTPQGDVYTAIDRFLPFIDHSAFALMRSIVFDMETLDTREWDSRDNPVYAAMATWIGRALGGLRDLADTDRERHFGLKFKLLTLGMVDIKVGAPDVDQPWEEKIAQLIPEKEDTFWAADWEKAIRGLKQCRIEDQERYRRVEETPTRT